MNTAETCSSSAEFPVGLDRSKAVAVVPGAAAAATELHDDDVMPEPTDEQGRFTTGSSINSMGSVHSGSYGGGTAPSPGRRRSMSLASGQPTLETVVVKAKRAASSLWILLHAQVRTRRDRCAVYLCAALPDILPSLSLRRLRNCINLVHVDLLRHGGKMPARRMSGGQDDAPASQDVSRQNHQQGSVSDALPRLRPSPEAAGALPAVQDRTIIVVVVIVIATRDLVGVTAERVVRLAARRALPDLLVRCEAGPDASGEGDRWRWYGEPSWQRRPCGRLWVVGIVVVVALPEAPSALQGRSHGVVRGQRGC
jgi:hypothetical protein